ncbi:MAG: signal peptidase II [Clostridiales bacterium]|nr:signal peptidase II [Clostridiales bacterium]
MFWICIAAVVILDQLTKYAVAANLALGQSWPLIDGVVYFTYVMNKGAAFSLLQGQRWFFIVITIVVLAVMLWFARGIPKSDRLLQSTLALFCGGALGNLIDRLRFGAVTDFIDFRFFPIFNVADSCIVIGAFLLGFCMLIRPKIGATKDDI